MEELEHKPYHFFLAPHGQNKDTNLAMITKANGEPVWISVS